MQVPAHSRKLSLDCYVITFFELIVHRPSQHILHLTSSVSSSLSFGTPACPQKTAANAACRIKNNMQLLISSSNAH